MKQLIIIEKNSLIIKLISFLFDTKITSIYYFHPYQLDQYSKKFEKKLNNFNEYQISHEIEQAITFKANKETLTILKKKKFKLILDFFNNINISDKILIAFKKYQLTKIASQIRLAFVIQYLKKNENKNLKIFCFMNNINNFHYAKDYLSNDDCNNFLNLNIIYFFSKLSSFLITFFYIPYFIAKHIFKNGISRNVTPKKYQFGFHYNNNIFDRSKFADNKNFLGSRSDFYLNKILNYNDRKNIYISSPQWQFSNENHLKNKKEMKYREADFGFELDNPLQFKVFYLAIVYYLNIIIFFFRNLFNKELSLSYIVTIIQILRDLLKSEIFCSKYHILNFISRDDFNPLHISRTLVFNKYNLNNNCITHSCCQEYYTSVIIPFNYFDICFTQGNFYYKDLFKKYWFSKRYINLGPLYGYLVQKALDDKKKKHKFEKKYGSYKKICFLIGSYDSNNNPFDIKDINFKSYHNLTKCLTYDKKIILFIVPRYSKKIDELLYSLENYDKVKDRVFVDKFYSTYELMAYCDYLITESLSSSIFEGTINPKLSILPLNSRKIYENPLYRYKGIKVFENGQEIFNTIMQHDKKKDAPVNNKNLKKLIWR
jgi:hypothetical protein